MIETRRRALVIAAAGAVAAVTMTLAATETVTAQRIGDLPASEILKPGALPDLVMGAADAKVTIVEYASMTCSHCADFHAKVLPALKAKYVDTGKVRFIFRELPWDNLAAAASMLTRCAGADKALPLVSKLFESQDTWAVKQGAMLKLFDVAKQAGFTQATFDTCLGDQSLLDKIAAGRDRATDTLKVEATPTFFVEGRKIEGGLSIAEFEKVLDALLQG